MSAVQEAGQARPWRVLIVDDEPDIRESLRDLLQAADERIECVIATDGQDGVDRLSEGHFDLIISDFRMPGMDGIEFLRHAQHVAPSAPRIMVTAFPDLDLAVRAINDARIDNFFTKPLDPAEVLAVVEQTLTSRGQTVARNQALARALAHAQRGGNHDGA